MEDIDTGNKAGRLNEEPRGFQESQPSVIRKEVEEARGGKAAKGMYAAR